MAYNFTITNAFNLAEQDIIAQAVEIAKADIVTFNLDPNSKLRMTDVRTENQNKIYTFAMAVENQNEPFDSSLNEKSHLPKTNSGIAATSL